MKLPIIEIIEQFGYLGIASLVALENIFPPIPSEVILTFGGFVTTISRLNMPGVVLAATIGSVIGALVLYGVGRLLNTERLERLCASRPGRLLRLKREDVRRAEGWFERYGYPAVFLCRFVPIVRSLISVPAGMAGMRLRPFLLLTAAGTLIWNIVLVWLGHLAGDAWENIAAYVDTYATLVMAALVIIVLIFGAVFVKGRFGRR
jgi:membrane protein DedA with SNARE-associated domain